MRLLLCIISVLSVVAFSKTVVQNDWSGGGGVPGPVFNWGTKYDTSTSIDDADSIVRLQADITEHLISGNFNGAVAAVAADVDSDGDLDVLGAAKAADEISWWENTGGSGTSWNKHMISGNFDGAMSVYACDVDGDNDIDVLGAAKAADDIIWWENTDGAGGSWNQHTVDGSFDGAMFVFAADVDGDNDIDVLGAAKAADDITWWENTNGSGTAWTEHTVDGTFDGAMSVHAADIDGDGDIDVLGAAKAADDITWWENTNGSGTAWIEHTVDSDFDHANSVYAADVNGDGYTDILGAAEWADDVTWWENANGSGTVWVEHTIDEFFDGVLSIHTADIDSDGDIDVLGAATGGNDIVWWENVDGTGTVWAEHVVKTNRSHDASADSSDTDDRYDSTMAAFAADINGDGSVDILGASSGYDDITWWEYGYPDVGCLESSILYAGSVSTWDSFSANIVQPPGTAAGFQFRSSASASDMGTWSDTVFSTSGTFSGILADSTSYMQYRLILQCFSSYHTPFLNSIECTLIEYTGIEDIAYRAALSIPQNPVHGTFSPEITTTVPGTVEISVYDISGRLTDTLSREFSKGTHTVHFHGLEVGVYFCVLSTDDFFDPQMLVMLE